MAKIRKDDTVLIMRGKDKGKSGKVREVHPKDGRLIVEGANMVKRHYKARGVGKPAGIVSMEAPIHVSNVMLVDPASGQPTKVGFRFGDDGKKLRVAKATGKDID
jgi:large subunit ribosomal protein L24